MSDSLITWEAAVQSLRDQPDKQDLVRACYYDQPVVGAVRRFATSEEWLATLDVVRPWTPGRVLDIGAGNGIASYAFAKASCTVDALEPDPSDEVGAGAIRGIAEIENLPITVSEAFGEKLPYDSDTFDIVYGRQVLHHAYDLPQLVREAGRVLKPGGVFIATREHVISKSADKEAFLKAHPLHALYGGENAFLLAEYLGAIQGAGLTVRQTFGSHDSVINYFPMTKSERRERYLSHLGKIVGRKMANIVAGSDASIDFIGKIRSLRDNGAGRLYTFVAVKPEGGRK
jgi:SAM-dependent methyltransferase